MTFRSNIDENSICGEVKKVAVGLMGLFFFLSYFFFQDNWFMLWLQAIEPALYNLRHWRAPLLSQLAHSQLMP